MSSSTKTASDAALEAAASRAAAAETEFSEMQQQLDACLQLLRSASLGDKAVGLMSLQQFLPQSIYASEDPPAMALKLLVLETVGVESLLQLLQLGEEGIEAGEVTEEEKQLFPQVALSMMAQLSASKELAAVFRSGLLLLCRVLSSAASPFLSKLEAMKVVHGILSAGCDAGDLGLGALLQSVAYAVEGAMSCLTEESGGSRGKKPSTSDEGEEEEEGDEDEDEDEQAAADGFASAEEKQEAAEDLCFFAMEVLEMAVTNSSSWVLQPVPGLQLLPQKNEPAVPVQPLSSPTDVLYCHLLSCVVRLYERCRSPSLHAQLQVCLLRLLILSSSSLEEATGAASSNALAYSPLSSLAASGSARSGSSSSGGGSSDFTHPRLAYPSWSSSMQRGLLRSMASESWMLPAPGSAREGAEEEEGGRAGSRGGAAGDGSGAFNPLQDKLQRTNLSAVQVRSRAMTLLLQLLNLFGPAWLLTDSFQAEGSASSQEGREEGADRRRGGKGPVLALSVSSSRAEGGKFFSAAVRLACIEVKLMLDEMDTMLVQDYRYGGVSISEGELQKSAEVAGTVQQRGSAEGESSKQLPPSTPPRGKKGSGSSSSSPAPAPAPAPAPTGISTSHLQVAALTRKQRTELAARCYDSFFQNLQVSLEVYAAAVKVLVAYGREAEMVAEAEGEAMKAAAASYRAAAQGTASTSATAAVGAAALSPPSFVSSFPVMSVDRILSLRSSLDEACSAILQFLSAVWASDLRGYFEGVLQVRPGQLLQQQQKEKGEKARKGKEGHAASEPTESKRKEQAEQEEADSAPLRFLLTSPITCMVARAAAVFLAEETDGPSRTLELADALCLLTRLSPLQDPTASQGASVLHFSEALSLISGDAGAVEAFRARFRHLLQQQQSQEQVDIELELLLRDKPSELSAAEDAASGPAGAAFTFASDPRYCLVPLLRNRLEAALMDLQDHAAEYARLHRHLQQGQGQDFESAAEMSLRLALQKGAGPGAAEGLQQGKGKKGAKEEEAESEEAAAADYTDTILQRIGDSGIAGWAASWMRKLLKIALLQQLSLQVLSQSAQQTQRALRSALQAGSKTDGKGRAPTSAAGAGGGGGDAEVSSVSAMIERHQDALGALLLKTQVRSAAARAEALNLCLSAFTTAAELVELLLRESSPARSKVLQGITAAPAGLSLSAPAAPAASTGKASGKAATAVATAAPSFTFSKDLQEMLELCTELPAFIRSFTSDSTSTAAALETTLALGGGSKGKGKDKENEGLSAAGEDLLMNSADAVDSGLTALRAIIDAAGALQQLPVKARQQLKALKEGGIAQLEALVEESLGLEGEEEREEEREEEESAVVAAGGQKKK